MRIQFTEKLQLFICNQLCFASILQLLQTVIILNLPKPIAIFLFVIFYSWNSNFNSISIDFHLLWKGFSWIIHSSLAGKWRFPPLIFIYIKAFNKIKKQCELFYLYSALSNFFSKINGKGFKSSSKQKRTVHFFVSLLRNQFLLPLNNAFRHLLNIYNCHWLGEEINFHVKVNLHS